MSATMATPVTAYTIISRDCQLLRWCVENARDRAGAEHEWIVVGWNQTDEIATECDRLGVRLVPLSLPELPGGGAHPESRTAVFVANLYKCWRAGMDHATTKWVARMGSDQAFSRDWLKNLLACAERHGERAIYDVNTVESPVAKRSRHLIRDWGSTPTEFDERGRAQFDAYADDLAWRFRSDPTVRGDKCDLWYDHQWKGRQRRSDGCTWLMTKALWEEVGGMPDAVMHGVAPDVAFRDRLSDMGVASYLCFTATTMHLVRGESREVQQ